MTKKGEQKQDQGAINPIAELFKAARVGNRQARQLLRKAAADRDHPFHDSAKAAQAKLRAHDDNVARQKAGIGSD